MKIPFSIQLAGLLGIFFALTSCDSKQTTAAPEKPSPGKQLVMESIAAHGGIEKWRSNGLLQFRWTYHMTDRGATADSIQTIDPLNFAAVHTVPGTDTSFGRATDGRYWIHPADAQFMPPVQFWALTPVYFLGIPFVFDDDQISFELLPETKSFEGKEYPQVKLTYADTAGESPDDHYVLLIDPDTKLVRGTYYTVTNPLVYKGGPIVEKFLTLDNLQEVDGLKLAGAHRTFAMPDGEIATEQMRYTDVSQVSFVDRSTIDFTPPEEARFLDATPSSE